MNDKFTMLEAVVRHEDAKEVFRQFCDDTNARDCMITPHKVETDCDAIVCGFVSDNAKQYFVGKMERLFPGKISWR